MSTFTTTTRITRRYLEGKTKAELASMYLDLLDRYTLVENVMPVLPHALCGVCYEKATTVVWDRVINGPVFACSREHAFLLVDTPDNRRGLITTSCPNCGCIQGV